MNNYLGLILAFWPIFLALGLLGIGGIGIWLDAEHRKELEYRRAQVGHVLVTDLRSLPGYDARVGRYALLNSEVVLSANRLITLFGKIRLLFGGEVKSFDDIMTRARQEATIRLMETAAEQGFDAIGNLRVEAVDIAGVTVKGRNANKQGIYIGILAYGTAYKRVEGFFPPPAAPTLVGYLS